ncbi:MAG: DNA-deoxyinosine glycosylase [Gammaproteobacteria bacterium]
MSVRHSLAPVARSDARVLILGSMPSTLSLKEQQYYARPRNAFWAIMGELYGAKRSLPYEQRLLILKDRRIALWDVLASCFRPGSMDADIRTGDAVANDFAAFHASHPDIRLVLFNGVRAEQLHARLVRPGLAVLIPDLRYARLPSTSPANAAARLDHKAAAWHEALRGATEPG